MALDEALFLWTLREGKAVARFYQWGEAATTVGYFHRRNGNGDSAEETGRPTRRFTGGGLVEHGEDLTFLITCPPQSDASRSSAANRYRWIHESLLEALANEELKARPALFRQGDSPAGPCFANPVTWDLMDGLSGEKLAGGAQRRSRVAVIHQGSIRLPPTLRNPHARWIDAFLEGLSENPAPLDEVTRTEALEVASQLEKDRYTSDHWNRFQ